MNKIIKKFPATTKHGLGISKTGRLMVPYVSSGKNISDGTNRYGQDCAKKGDYICMSTGNGMISLSRIGTVKMQEEVRTFGNATLLERWDKALCHESEWTKDVFVLTKDEYEDALDYLKTKRK